jgi:hypothetical protein
LIPTAIGGQVTAPVHHFFSALIVVMTGNLTGKTWIRQKLKKTNGNENRTMKEWLYWLQERSPGHYHFIGNHRTQACTFIAFDSTSDFEET